MNEGKKIHTLNKESLNNISFSIDINKGRELLGEKYNHLNDQEIEKIMNVTINIGNLIINSYLDSLGKTR